MGYGERGARGGQITGRKTNIAQVAGNQHAQEHGHVCAPAAVDGLVKLLHAAMAFVAMPWISSITKRAAISVLA